MSRRLLRTSAAAVILAACAGAALAPVQTDKTAQSFEEMRRELGELAGTRPVSGEELTLAQGDPTKSLPRRWETNQAVAGTLAKLLGYGLPDTYYSTYASRIGALTTADVARAAHAVVLPNAFTWVVVGDRKKIEPDLKAMGLQIRNIDADGRPAA